METSILFDSSKMDNLFVQRTAPARLSGFAGLAASTTVNPFTVSSVSNWIDPLSGPNVSKWLDSPIGVGTSKRIGCFNHFGVSKALYPYVYYNGLKESDEFEGLDNIWNTRKSLSQLTAANPFTTVWSTSHVPADITKNTTEVPKPSIGYSPSDSLFESSEVYERKDTTSHGKDEISSDIELELYQIQAQFAFWRTYEALRTHGSHLNNGVLLFITAELLRVSAGVVTGPQSLALSALGSALAIYEYIQSER